MGNILTLVTRGEGTESVHNGHIAVVKPEGEILFGYGDPNFKTFFRSAMKPIQAAIVLESGAIEKFKLSEKEVAIISASHSGESKHIKLVENILKKAKIPQRYLHCGKAMPHHKPSLQKLLNKGSAEKSIYHNCSGKHAGILAATKTLKLDCNNYFSIKNEVQKSIILLLCKYSGISINKMSFGIDGCGLPNAALPLSAMAITYAKLANEFGKSSIGKIGKIMSENPWIIGGTNRLDTELMEHFKGSLVVKGGAEGLLCMAIPAKKIGIAIKCEDGSHRPLPIIAITLLEKLGVIKKDELATLKKKFTHWHCVFNSRKSTVGEIISKI